MRLELRSIDISKVQFGEKTEIRDGQLLIDRDELIALLLEDRRLGRVTIELAHPGESCRILQVSDVIEPRAKIGKTGEDIPGVIGKQSSAGQGQTCVLRGAAVVINDQSVLSGPAHDPVGSIFDMTGPAAEITPYAQTHNIAVLPFFHDDSHCRHSWFKQSHTGWGYPPSGRQCGSEPRRRETISTETRRTIIGSVENKTCRTKAVSPTVTRGAGMLSPATQLLKSWLD